MRLDVLWCEKQVLFNLRFTDVYLGFLVQEEIAVSAICNLFIHGNMQQTEYLLKVNAVPALCNVLNVKKDDEEREKKVHSRLIFIVLSSSNINTFEINL